MLVIINVIHAKFCHNLFCVLKRNSNNLNQSPLCNACWSFQKKKKHEIVSNKHINIHKKLFDTYNRNVNYAY